MKYGFFIFMLTVFSILVGYSTLRGWQTLREFPLCRTIYLALMIVLFVSLFVGLGVGHRLPAALGKITAFIGYTGFIIFVYFFISFLLVDAVRLINHFTHFAPEGMISFRKWAFAASAVVIGVAMIIGNYKFNHPKVVEFEVNVKDRAKQNKELRIVTASDLHIGVSIDKKKLGEYIDLINLQQPDIVLFAGDIIDNSLYSVINQNMKEEFRKINAPLGVYTILGNHEYISSDVENALTYLQSGNMQMLRDSAFLVDDSFYIIGRDDKMNSDRKSLAELTKGLDNTKPTILLDHQPYHLEEAEENNIDLQISGHTHNGQFFPFNLIVRSMYENPHGYSTRGKTHYYVSSGLGIWGPQYRIGTQSELIVITLKY